MNPSDPTPRPDDSASGEPLPARSEMARDPHEEMWDLDDEGDLEEDDFSGELPEPSPPSSQSADFGMPTRPMPRAVEEAEHIRKSMKAGDSPNAPTKKAKPVRPVTPLRNARTGFESLDDLAELGDLEEPHLYERKATAETAGSSDEPIAEAGAPQPPADGFQAAPADDQADSQGKADAAQTAASPSEAPFEAPKQESDEDKETLLKELRKGWLGGLRFLIRRIRAFSLIEQLCCVLTLIGIIGFSTAVFFPALFGFPKKHEYLESKDFPVKGVAVEVRSANTYWREPVVNGPNADTVRMGVALLPVIEMRVRAESGRIRLLFRDSDGELVGDPMSQSFQGEQTLSLTATTGLTDTGIFSAYRTGEIEPWSVEVHEADGNDFKLIFKMNIAPILK